MSDEKPSRRKLRFETIDDVLADAEALLAAERAGKLKRAGNWTLGQALGHLATWAGFGFESYPPALRDPPWYMRIVGKMLRRRILNKGMISGVRIPGIREGTIGTDDMPADEGLDRLRRALARLRERAPTIPNPLLGHMPHEDWIKLNLRHAELHLSYQVPA